MVYSLETNLSRTAFPEDGGTTECRVEIEISESARKLPANIIFCLDTSGSMSGRKMEQAIDGTERALTELTEDDSFGVVTFDNDADVIVEPTSGSRAGSVSLSSVNSGGGTQIIDGLRVAADQLKSMRGSAEAVEWIALITDGRPSSGDSLETLLSGFGSGLSGTVERHARAAEELNDRGITINTAGVGSSYGADVIEALSINSGGTWEHHSSASGVESFFTEQIDEAHDVVATNPTLEFEPHNGVSVTGLARTVPQMAEVDYDHNGAVYRVSDVPELKQSVTPEYLLDLDVPPHEIDPSVELGEVRLILDDETRTERPTVEFTVDTEMAETMDRGVTEVSEESEAVDAYLGRKSDLDRAERAEQSRQIARKRE